jgi:hypothetical protein
MNADAMEAVAKLIRAVDAAACELGLMMSGTVQVGDDGSPNGLGLIRFNDGSESTWEER